MTAPSNVTYEIGELRIDTGRRVLLSARSGAPIPLPHKVFETLLYFVEHRGQLLEKAMLLSAIWPDTVVEENNLNQAITTLRRVLGERRGEHRFIVTVPGRGYRFVAEVGVRDASTPAALAAAPAASRGSIAVLPFANLTGDAGQQYLCDGIAAELIHMLAKAPGLSVCSRTSSFAYQGRNLDIRQIGRDLSCAAIVEGSVRSDGAQIHVTVQLIDADSGFHIWSQTYARNAGELFKLQDELASAVVRAVSNESYESSLAAVGSTQGTRELDAYRLYLQGVSLLQLSPDFRTFGSAIALLEQAIARDPAFARAYAAAALAHYIVSPESEDTRSHLDAAQRLAQQGLALDPTLAESEHVLGLDSAARSKWLDAERHFRRALTLDPAIAGQTAHAFNVTAAVGHLRAALRGGQEAYRLAPGSALISVQLACFYSFLGLDAQALEHVAIGASLGWSEDTVPSAIVLAQAARRAGRHAQAAEHIVRIFPARMPIPDVHALVRLVFSAAGDASSRGAALDALRNHFAQHGHAILRAPSLPIILMFCATLLGDLDLAYDIASRRVDEFERTGAIVVVNFMPQLWLPELRAFRQDPRFHDLVSRLGLLDYWHENGPPDDCELRHGRLICP